MKNLKFYLFALAISLFSFGFSQNTIDKVAAKKATEFTEEIKSVIELTPEQSEKVYEIQLNRFTQAITVNRTYKDQPEVRKEKLKAISKDTFIQMKTLLGQEKMKAWGAYKREQNENNG